MNKEIILLFLIILISFFIIFLIYQEKNNKNNKNNNNNNKENKNNENNILNNCGKTRYGCCNDNKTPKLDNDGTNCFPKPFGGCEGTRYGCCEDNKTSKLDNEGSNCSENLKTMNENYESKSIMKGNCSSNKIINGYNYNDITFMTL
jgi:hypothetical protein